MSRPVLILFTRIPRLGIGKRRLARSIGDRRALRLARHMLTQTQRRLRGLRGITRIIAITPDHHQRLSAPGWQQIGQGRGDLGERMQRAIGHYPNRSVILIGSDIPDITAADIRQAVRLLRGHQAVFGPAEDGGYWLIGQSGRRPALPFAHVRWSTPHALADTSTNFTRQRTKWLRWLCDIDDAPGNQPAPGVVSRFEIRLGDRH